MRAIARKFYVEAQSQHALTRLLEQVRGVCVDMGTELGSADHAGLQSSDLIPAWANEARGIEKDTGVVDSIHGNCTPKSSCLAPSALLPPGMVHMLEKPGSLC